jgi:hypothetical protein
VSFLVIGRSFLRIPRWRRFGSWLFLASPLTLVLLVLDFAMFDPVASGQGLGVAGLTERILITEFLAWIVAMGWKVLRGL